MVNPTSDMTVSSPSFVFGHHSNSNLVASNYYQHHHPNSDKPNSNTHYSYTNPSASTSSLNYMDLLRTWNYHQFLTSSSLKTDQLSDNSSSDCHPRNSSFHQYSPRLLEKRSSQQTDDEYILGKFHHDTLVNLDSGETKNIQQLTTNDFLTSAKQSQQYSSLLARIDYIGSIDQSTGKVELRFYIDDIEKTTSYYVLQEMPFFVQQYSCWSSVSPEYTHRLCGLKCRQLECGDKIIAVTEQRKSSLTKPNYSQQSPTKSLVGRYMNGQISSSNKRHKISNE